MMIMGISLLYALYISIIVSSLYRAKKRATHLKGLHFTYRIIPYNSQGSKNSKIYIVDLAQCLTCKNKTKQSISNLYTVQ